MSDRKNIFEKFCFSFGIFDGYAVEGSRKGKNTELPPQKKGGECYGLS